MFREGRPSILDARMRGHDIADLGVMPAKAGAQSKAASHC